MTTTPNPRQQLRDAIEANAEALAKMHDAELTLQKANNLHCLLAAKRADVFQDLDDQIATARAANLKRALDNDEDAGLITTRQPEGFASALIAREQLDERIQTVEASIPVLESEFEEARKAAELAEFNLDCARERVFVEEATQLAQEFEQGILEMRRLSARLRFMSLRQVRRSPDARNVTGGQFYGQGANRAVTMPKAVIEAVHEDITGSFVIKGGGKVFDQIGHDVTRYWAALRTNPDAEFHAQDTTADRLSSCADSSIRVKDAAE